MHPPAGKEEDGFECDRSRVRTHRKSKSNSPAAPPISGHDRSTTVTAMEAQGPDLEAITARLRRIAEELEAAPDSERAAELVRQASDSAAEAGRAVEAAMRAATDTSSP
jgi:hypothetical protein